MKKTLLGLFSVLLLFGTVQKSFAYDYADNEMQCPSGTVPASVGYCWLRTPADFDWYGTYPPETWTDYPLTDWAYLYTFRVIAGYYRQPNFPCTASNPYLSFLQTSSRNRVRYACNNTPPTPPTPPPSTLNLTCKGKNIATKKVNGRDVNVEWTAFSTGNITPKTYTWGGGVTGTGIKAYSLVYKGDGANANISGTGVDSKGKTINSTNISDGTNVCSISVPLDTLKTTCTAKLVNSTSSNGTLTNVQFTAKTSGGTNTKYFWVGDAINSPNSSIVNVYSKPGDTAMASVNVEADFTNFDKGSYTVKSSNKDNWCLVKVPSVPAPKITCTGKFSDDNANIDWTLTVNNKSYKYSPSWFSYVWKDGSTSSSSSTKIPDDIGVLDAVVDEVVVSYPDALETTVQCTYTACPTLAKKLRSDMGTYLSKAKKDYAESGELLACFRDGTVKSYAASTISYSRMDFMKAILSMDSDSDNKYNGLYSVTTLHNHPTNSVKSDMCITRYISGVGITPSIIDIKSVSAIKDILNYGHKNLKYYFYVLDGEGKIWNYDYPLTSRLVDPIVATKMGTDNENVWKSPDGIMWSSCEGSRLTSQKSSDDYLKFLRLYGAKVDTVYLPGLTK